MSIIKTVRVIIYMAIFASTSFISGCGVFNQELRTEIEIESSPEKVWSILTDFEEFPNWNPMIRRVEGQPVVGEKLDIFVQAEGTKGMEFKPTVLKVDQNRELRWLGKLGMRGIFDGEHIFTIEPKTDESVVFVHREKFSGLMIPVMFRFMAEDTLRGFNDMNKAIKTLSESAESY